MKIDFSPERWDRVKETYAKWWDGKLDRALVRATAIKADAPVFKGVLSQANCHDFSVSAEEIVDGIEYELSRKAFLGDGFPMFSMDAFGPGVLAAFCGGILDNSSGSVWFFPDKKREIADIHIEYDSNNVWVRRVKDIYHAANKRFNGNVLMGMVDMGGPMDVLATFRGTEDLLLDLYDNPEEVKRVCREIEDCWFEAYNDLNDVLMEKNPGYSDWNGLYSQTPYYILQCDFSYMISPEMFKEFALPGLQSMADRLDHATYHLDGKGELPHLDMILGIEKLRNIQWVPGAGNPHGIYWLDVYKKIAASGKDYQIISDVDEMKKIKDVLGGKGMYLDLYFGDEKTAMETIQYLWD